MFYLKKCNNILALEMPSLLNYYWFNLPLFRSRLRAKSQVKVHSQIGKRKVGQLSDGHV